MPPVQILCACVTKTPCHITTSATQRGHEDHRRHLTITTSQLTDDSIKETNQIVSCEGCLQRLLQSVLSKGVETDHPQRLALLGLGGAMTELQLCDGSFGCDAVGLRTLNEGFDGCVARKWLTLTTLLSFHAVLLFPRDLSRLFLVFFSSYIPTKQWHHYPWRLIQERKIGLDPR